MKSLLNVSIDDLHKRKVIEWGYSEQSIPKTLEYYQKWLSKDLHGSLSYLADHRAEARSDIKHFYPEFQSALCFLFDYRASAKNNIENDDFRFAAYTQEFDGMDYHYWIKEKLEEIASLLELNDYKISLDMHPVLERDLAESAGLGWFGKNSMLINRKFGSYFLIGSILTNKKLELDTPTIETDHCGNCTACIDACPTDAIIDNKVIDAQKCISTYTIELFKDSEAAPSGFPANSGEFFGCDICQRVCPWNNKPLKDVEVAERPEWFHFFNRPTDEIIKDLESISNREYKRVFRGTSLERLGRIGLLKNLKHITN